MKQQLAVLLLLTASAPCACFWPHAVRPVSRFQQPVVARRGGPMWSSPQDPSADMIRRKVNTTEAATAPAPPSAAAAPPKKRNQMPPLRESMALLFSPDKRKIDGNRQKFRELISDLLASPMETIIPTITSNVAFLLSTNSSIFMQEMLEDLDELQEGTLLPVGEYKVTVEQQRASLMNLFTLMMDYIELFVQHTKSEMRTHQGVLREILEAAQSGDDAVLNAKISELRPYFREDFMTFMQSEYIRVTTPPMTDEAVTLANLLQVIQARLLAEMETLVGSEAGLVSKLLAYEDDTKLTSALEGSFQTGTVDPRQFLYMVETVLLDLDEKMPGPLGGGREAEELRAMQAKLRVIRQFTEEYIQRS